MLYFGNTRCTNLQENCGTTFWPADGIFACNFLSRFFSFYNRELCEACRLVRRFFSLFQDHSLRLLVSTWPKVVVTFIYIYVALALAERGGGVYVVHAPIIVALCCYSYCLISSTFYYIRQKLVVSNIAPSDRKMHGFLD